MVQDTIDLCGHCGLEHKAVTHFYSLKLIKKGLDASKRRLALWYKTQ